MESGTAKRKKPTPYEYQMVLANFFAGLSAKRAWYYKIVGDSNSRREATLSSLLGIPSEVCHYLLSKCDLLRMRKDGNILVPEAKWSNFILGFGLTADGVEHHLYYLRTKHPDGTEHKTRARFLLIGNFNAYETKWTYRDRAEYEQPSIRVPALRDNFVREISVLLHADLQSELGHTRNHDEIIQLSTATLAMLSDFNPSNAPVTFDEVPAAVNVEATTEVPLELPHDVASGSEINDPPIGSMENLPCTCTCKCRARESFFRVFKRVVPQDKAKYPCLNFWGIATIPDLQGVLTEMKKLSEEEDVRGEFDMHNIANANCPRAPMHIFFTPQASSYDRFIRTAEETKWVEKLLMTMPRKKVTDGCEDEDILSLSTAWLLKYLAKRLPDVYENVSKKVGFRKVGEQKMTAESQAAMIMEGNISLKTLRQFRKYLTVFNGGVSLLESEKRLKDLAKGVVVPTLESIVHEGKILNFQIHDINRLLCVKLAQFVESSDISFVNNAKHIDIIFGGDHGQGKFKALIKVLFRLCIDGVKLTKALEYTVAEIECAKDTAVIFDKTIAGPINSALDAISKSGGLCVQKGSPRIVEFCAPAAASTMENVEKVIPIKHMVVTGDLAFYAMILGKSNGAGHWCWLCNLSKSQWQIRRSERTAGEAWCLDKIKRIARNMESGSTYANSSDVRRGVKTAPLLDAVEVKFYVIPLLHVLLGVGNDSMRHFFNWIDDRCERHDEILNGLRRIRTLAMVAFESAESGQKQWKAENDPKVEELNTRREDLLDQLESLKNNRIEKGIVLHQLRICNESLKRQREERQAWETTVKTAKTAYTTTRKAEEERKKERPWEERKIKNELEKILATYGVSNAKYHGGTYEGVTLLKLMNDLDDIFDEIQIYLINELQRDATGMICTKEEIKEVCGHYKELLGLVDGTFSILRTKSDDIQEHHYQLADRFITALLEKWRAFGFRVTPKLHSIEDHGVPDMMFFEGIGDYGEDFIERAHQDTAKEKQLAGRLKDRTKRVTCLETRKAIFSNPAVQAAKKEVKEKSIKRKSGSGGISRAEENKKKAKMDRFERRMRVLEHFEANETSKIPNGFERCVLDASNRN